MSNPRNVGETAALLAQAMALIEQHLYGPRIAPWTTNEDIFAIVHDSIQHCWQRLLGAQCAEVIPLSERTQEIFAILMSDAAIEEAKLKAGNGPARAEG